VKFRNPTNGYIEEVQFPGLWTFLFGGLYFATKGIWTHFIAGFVLAVCTFGVSWFIYPFFASDIIRSHYLRKGWVEVTDTQTGQTSATTERKCPFCAEIIKREATVCRYCGRELPQPVAQVHPGDRAIHLPGHKPVQEQEQQPRIRRLRME
jgi:hypothetical protein